MWRTLRSVSISPRASSSDSSSNEESKWSSMARFWLLVTMMTCSIPAATASSTAYWMTGLSTSGSISLGDAFVAGRKRVPHPAAGKTALRTRIGPRCGGGAGAGGGGGGALRSTRTQDDLREGDADLPEDLDGDEEAGEEEDHAEELAQLEEGRHVEAIEAVGDARDEGRDGDGGRRRDAAVDAARPHRPPRPRQRGHEVDGDGDG